MTIEYGQISECQIGIINSLITALIRNGLNKRALEIYPKFSETKSDNISHPLALKACINCKEFGKGLEIISKINKSTKYIFIQTAMIDFFGKFGD